MVVRYALAKQKAVRWHRRAETVGDVDRELADRMLHEANCTREEAEEIYKLTALCTFEDRFVIPPMHREQAIEMMKEPHEHREETGFGFVGGPRRGLVMSHIAQSTRCACSRAASATRTEHTVASGRIAVHRLCRTTSRMRRRAFRSSGSFVEQHELWQIEETFTRTFDVNPACALEVGWHLFGEEYARGHVPGADA